MLFLSINIFSESTEKKSEEAKEEKRVKKYATWYGGKFHGRKTTSGEVYNMYGMTAAHRTLPFGTYVKVTNCKSGKSVVVKINDRGPWQKKYTIDLSYAAFNKIRGKNDGEMQVYLDIVSKEEYEKQKNNDTETVTTAPAIEIPVDITTGNGIEIVDAVTPAAVDVTTSESIIVNSENN